MDIITGDFSPPDYRMCTLFAIFRLTESLDKSKIRLQVRRKFNISNLVDALTHPNICIMIIMFSMLMFAISNIYSIIALFFYKNFNFSDQINGFVLGYIGLIGAISQGSIGFLTKKFNEKKLLIVGNLFSAVGMLLIPYTSSFLFLFTILFFYSIGNGLNHTIIPSLISQFVEQEEQGGTLELN